MTEIWNLNTLCRCCHSDGSFESLNKSYPSIKVEESYEFLLEETLNIKISQPEIDVSYTICDKCITRLRDASQFKQQVLACEEKFKIYCTNELFQSSDAIETLKSETVSSDNEIDNGHSFEDYNKEVDKFKGPTTITEMLEFESDSSVANEEDNNSNDTDEGEGDKFKGPAITEMLEFESDSSVANEEDNNSNDTDEGEDQSNGLKKKRSCCNIDSKKKREIIALHGEGQNFSEIARDIGISFANATSSRIALTEYEMWEAAPTLDDSNLQISDENNRFNIKKEIQIEVDMKYPIEMIKDNENIQNEEIEIEVEMKYPIKMIKDNENIKNEVKQVDDKTGCIKKKVKKITKRDPSNTEVNKSQITTTKTDNTQTYSCKECEKTYQTKKEIYRHTNLQHGKFKCNECGKHFLRLYYLKRHLKSHNINYNCYQCDKKFKSKNSLKVHENTHTKKHFYQCDICKKELGYKNSLIKHIRTHFEEKKELLCDICGWSFYQKCNLEAHIKTVHLKLRPYACPECDKTYSAKKHLKYHLKTAHSSNPRPYICDICLKSFACPKSLKIHKLRHNNQFTCRYCSIVYGNKKEFDIHIKSHAREHFLNSPYTCHLCGKVLMTKFTLTRHIDTHNGVKKFSCEICEMRFSQKCLLIRHVKRKHNPNSLTEKVKCDICKKLVRDLDKHMGIHSSEKRKYFCDLCGKSYPENNTLTRHKNQVHYGVCYDCDICGKKYTKKTSLEAHKFKIHKIKKEVLDFRSSQKGFINVN